MSFSSNSNRTHTQFIPSLIEIIIIRSRRRHSLLFIFITLRKSNSFAFPQAIFPIRQLTFIKRLRRLIIPWRWLGLVLANFINSIYAFKCLCLLVPWAYFLVNFSFLIFAWEIWSWCQWASENGFFNESTVFQIVWAWLLPEWAEVFYAYVQLLLVDWTWVVLLFVLLDYFLCGCCAWRF